MHYFKEEHIQTRGKDGLEYTGTYYKLNKNYKLTNYGTEKKPKIFRNWETVEVLYGRDINMKRRRPFYMDSEDNFVFLV